MALCFVAVLGISLASYIAVCSRAMTLSNRSFQGNLSKQLAEAGIEEALRAFNQNDWNDWSNGGYAANWTLDTTNKRATATLTFPSGKFGQGTTATVKIRVDNYDAARLGVSWNNAKTYRVNDIVGYNGVWYRSVKDDNTNHTPGVTDLTWWVPAPIVWTWGSNISYTAYQDIVCYDGSWWLCDTTHTSGSSFSWSNWTSVAAPDLAWSSWAWYGTGQYVYRASDSTWYRCTTGHFAFGWDGSKYTVSSWSYRASETYSFDDVVHHNGNWYRYINGTPASGITAGSNSAYWENALSGGTHGWISGVRFNLGDTVYYNATGSWYRCIRAHTSSGSLTPTDTAYWSNTPLFSVTWDSGKQYSQNDTVSYNGMWYLSLQNSNISQNPSTATSYWIGTNTTNASYTWNNTTNYAVGVYRCYGRVWYRCVKTGNLGRSPNDTEFWTAAWSNSWGVTTGAPVVYTESTVTIANGPFLKTQLRAPIAPSPLFPNAAAATTDLTITTGTGTVDSYDSTIGPLSATQYTDQINTSTNYSAVLAAGTTLAINGTTAVKGYLAWPSPPAGISTGTTVKGASSPASPNMDTSRVSRSPYIPQFDILPRGGLQNAYSNNDFPRGTLLPNNPSGTINIGTPGSTSPSRYYYSGTLRIGSSTPAMEVLNIKGPVILYVSAYLRLEDDGIIDIASTGSAEIHVGGLFRSYTDSLGIRNRTFDPKKLTLLIDGSASADTYIANTTNRNFYGVIYAPYLTHAIGQEIGTGINLYGAISAREITFSSEADIHYDTSLRYATIGGVDQPYAVTEWRELPISEQATMP